VVEIGSGTGLTLPHYLHADRVAAIEPDEGMASRIPPKAAESPAAVEVFDAEAEALPFADESFDEAVTIFVLCSVRDQPAALGEIRRVLRPGGTLNVLEHVRGHGRVARWQDRLNPLQRKVFGNCHLNRDTRTAIAAAGFDVAAVDDTRIPGSFPLVRAGIYGRAIKTSS
jgi:ubiquinone/menaquinone biosynthesis C-methylase UbiE